MSRKNEQNEPHELPRSSFGSWRLLCPSTWKNNICYFVRFSQINHCASCLAIDRNRHWIRIIWRERGICSLIEESVPLSECKSNHPLVWNQILAPFGLIESRGVARLTEELNQVNSRQSYYTQTFEHPMRNQSTNDSFLDPWSFHFGWLIKIYLA